MGASQSKLSSEEVNELTQISHFTTREIHSLFERFCQLDRNKDGLLSAAELSLIPELSMSPMCNRIIGLFDQDSSDQINFSRFVQTLSWFHPRASPTEKLQVVFKCYDVDQDSYISENDLFHVLKMLVGANLDDSKLKTIVHKTLKDSGATDGKLDFPTFAKALGDASSLSVTL